MALRKRQRLRIVAAEAQAEQGASDVTTMTVGALLRSERERRGLELDDAASQLRIRRVHLDAIEAGRFSALPGAPYALGFVRSYAEFLQLDSQEIVRRFKAEAAGLKGRQELNFPQPISESRLPTGLILFASLLIAAGAYGFWYFEIAGERVPLPRVSAVPESLTALVPPPAASPAPATADSVPAPSTPAAEPAQPEAARPETPAPPAGAVSAPTVSSSPPEALPSAAPAPAPATVSPAVVAEVPSPSPAAPVSAPPPAADIAAAAPAPAAPGPSNAPATAARSEPAPAAMTALPADAPPAPRVYGDTSGSSRIAIRATADSWVQVRDEGGNVVFMRILRSGDTYHAPRRPGLLLYTGNAGALEVRVDGKMAPPLGRAGMVRRDIMLEPDRLLAGTAATEGLRSAPDETRPAPSGG